MNEETASEPNGLIRRIRLSDDRELILVGTAHVSRASRDLVREVIETEQPDTVCVELCESRYQAIRQKEQWQEMDIVKVIKENKTFLLFSSLLLSSFQRRIARNLDIQPGAEMIQAVESAEALGARIVLADRDVRTTLTRAWQAIPFLGKIRLLAQLLSTMFGADDISEEDIEAIKQQDVMETLMADMGKYHPQLKRILIDERDHYLAGRIREEAGQRTVVVVGAGHLNGIVAHLNEPVDLAALGTTAEKGRFSGWLGWGMCGLVLAIIAAGFFMGGSHVGGKMMLSWVLITGILAGVGAVAALAHPLTILSSVVAAPLTTLHPLIAVGWVSGLVEAWYRKPRVRDIESLPEDILTVKGFWKNQVTRILLVVIFTNLGASIGTFIGIPTLLHMM
uniref:TraB/GumN family protein n=1 Tax=Desulfatirhabdium butyrativorans TaxID=340467 RepID=A0A7C4MLZ1_9BACT